jgi:hypothetical protein
MDKLTRDKMEHIINSTNGMQRAEAPAFFATRTEAALDRYLEDRQGRSSWLLMPKPLAWSLGLCLLLVANIASFTALQKTGVQKPAQTNTLQSFMQEYDLNTNYEEY